MIIQVNKYNTLISYEILRSKYSDRKEPFLKYKTGFLRTVNQCLQMSKSEKHYERAFHI